MDSESIIRIAREVATKESLEAFLVGGPVRDRELGVPVIDVDFTLEKGGAAFASALAKALDGELRVFPHFMTWKIVLREGTEVDVATTRRESYAHPGALPVVEAASLDEDLFRRDYSVNALAEKLGSGEIVDPLGGLADLRARSFRVLHDRSFRDDPTRILRGLRLSSRLHFTLETRTRQLCSEAIASDVFASISRERLWREFFLALLEASPAAVLSKMTQTGALSWLGTVDASNLPAAERVSRASSDADRRILYVATLLSGRHDVTPALSGSGFSRRELDLLMRLVLDSSRLCKALAATDFYDNCRFSSEVELLFMESLGSDCAAAAARCRAYRDVDLGFSATALEVSPGPHIGRALEETRRALFSGTIETAEAMNFARARALQYLNE